jgi:hypothetical protein
MRPISSGFSSRSAEIDSCPKITPSANRGGALRARARRARTHAGANNPDRGAGTRAFASPLFEGKNQGEKSLPHSKSADSLSLRYFRSDTYVFDGEPRSREVFAGCRGRLKANRVASGGRADVVFGLQMAVSRDGSQVTLRVPSVVPADRCPRSFNDVIARISPLLQLIFHLHSRREVSTDGMV